MSSPCSLAVFACSTNGLVVIPPHLSHALISFFKKSRCYFHNLYCVTQFSHVKQYKHAPTSLAVSRRT